MTALALAARLEKQGALTPVAMILPEDITLARWAAVGAMLGETNSATTWWIGDWVNFGEQVFGEEHSQAIDSIGLSHETLRQYRRICEQIPPERRRKGLAMGVHRLVAPLEPAEQDKWLNAAEENGWGRTALAAAMGIKPAGTLPPGEDSDRPAEVNPLYEAASAVLRDAHETEDPAWWQVPTETVARLRSALGE